MKTSISSQQLFPTLIAMKGHPGSGKSAVARALGRQLGLPVIDKDDIKDVLDNICQDSGGLAYTAMFNIARRQLLQNLSVICDSPLSEPAGYTAACCIAHDTTAHLVVIECFCSSEEEWRRRIEQRSALRLPDHHVTSWPDLEAHMRRRHKVSNYAISEPHLVVDTFTSLNDVLVRIVSWLQEIGVVRECFENSPNLVSSSNGAGHATPIDTNRPIVEQAADSKQQAKKRLVR